MFDTHCHINLEVFSKNMIEVINAAREAGVEYFLIPAIDKKTSKKAVTIANLYNGVYAAVGIHPTDDSLEKINPVKLFLTFEELIKDNEKVLAVGETGLDYYRYTAPSRVQQEFLKRHIKLALRYDKALVVHSRQASFDVIKILKDNWSEAMRNRVVLHAAEADEDVLTFSEKRETYIGIDGDITYDEKKQEFIKKTPIELLVLETDSPYLTPNPVRDEKSFPNKPENLIFVAKKVAEIKDMSIERVIEYTTNNAKVLFGLD